MLIYILMFLVIQLLFGSFFSKCVSAFHSIDLLLLLFNMVSQEKLARNPEFQSNLCTNLPKSQCFHLPLSLKELTFYITAYLSAVSKTKQSKHNKTQRILPNISLKILNYLEALGRKHKQMLSQSLARNVSLRYQPLVYILPTPLRLC